MIKTWTWYSNLLMLGIGLLFASTITLDKTRKENIDISRE